MSSHLPTNDADSNSATKEIFPLVVAGVVNSTHTSSDPFSSDTKTDGSALN